MIKPKIIDSEPMYDPYMFWIGIIFKFTSSSLILLWLIEFNLSSNSKILIPVLNILILCLLGTSFYYFFHSKTNRYITIYSWALLGIVLMTIFLCLMVAFPTFILGIPVIYNPMEYIRP